MIYLVLNKVCFLEFSRDLNSNQTDRKWLKCLIRSALEYAPQVTSSSDHYNKMVESAQYQALKIIAKGEMACSNKFLHHWSGSEWETRNTRSKLPHKWNRQWQPTIT